MSLDFSGKVAIVTGAGGGLGRAHALALAARGARVAVNDLTPSAVEQVVSEITAAGGQALAAPGSVTDYESVCNIVEKVHQAWGSVDILVNNAGILRDKSFAKMDLDDFKIVFDVHVMGAVNFTKAVWPIMAAQKYGRIVMTTSSSGLYGNFGQSNYGAAKMALVGLMQTLAIEGMKNNIKVNCLAPTASTQMTANLLPPAALDLLKPEAVVPALLVLAHQDAPNRMILTAGAGTFASATISLTNGTHLGLGADVASSLLASLGSISSMDGAIQPHSGSEQAQREIGQALAVQHLS